MSEARKAKFEEINKVSLALWEPDGTISFFVSPQQQALTPEDLQIVKKPFSIPKTIMKEGEIDFNELHYAGKDKAWLEDKMVKLNVRQHEIVLATLDEYGEMKVYLYD